MYSTQRTNDSYTLQLFESRNENIKKSIYTPWKILKRAGQLAFRISSQLGPPQLNRIYI